MFPSDSKLIPVDMKVASLFAGIGGIDLAFEQAGHQVVWVNDKDKYACMTYRHNFPDVNLVEGDIRKIDKECLPDFDILTAGFPCQSFSVCGKQKGFADERGNLFFEIGKVIDAKKPKIVFLENVANLTEHDHGKTFNVIFNELARRGYFIRYIIADACNYGVPQHRTRTYILAFQNKAECDEFRFSEEEPLLKHICEAVDFSVKSEDGLYYAPESPKYERLSRAVTDSNQIYRFADYGIQSSKEGIALTLKANMGTYPDRIPIVRDNCGI